MNVPLRESLETASDSFEAKPPPRRSSSRWWYLASGILSGCFLILMVVGLKGQVSQLFSAPASPTLGLPLEPVRLAEGRVSQMPYASYPTPLSRSGALQLSQVSRRLLENPARSATQLKDRALGFLL